MNLVARIVDVFTKEAGKGNRAGVVLHADKFSEGQMQEVARVLGFSETAFVLAQDGNDHEVRIRYFTPTMEVPVCGHATIAAHYVNAIERNKASGAIIQKTKAGLQTIEYEKRGSDYRILMVQNKPEFGLVVEGNQKSELLANLALQETDLRYDAPIQVVSTGHSKVIIPLNSRQKLDSLSPNLEGLKYLSEKIGCNGYFPFTIESPQTEILTHGRMFAPAIGINEDPVTGNAHGPLGAFLVRYGLVMHNGISFDFKGEQGSAIRKEGFVHAYIGIHDRVPVSAKITGDALLAENRKINVSDRI